MPHLLLAGLNDYRARGSDATPYLTVTHYTDFAETKGVVLVRGDGVLTSKLSDKEVCILFASKS
jgi:ATP synthase F1 complex assembly factor 1